MTNHFHSISSKVPRVSCVGKRVERWAQDESFIFKICGNIRRPVFTQITVPFGPAELFESLHATARRVGSIGMGADSFDFSWSTTDASLGSIQILHDISICVKSGHQYPPKPRILKGFGMGWGSFDSGVDFCWLMIDRSNLASRCLYKHRINKSQVFLVQNDHFQAIRLGFLAKRFFFDRVGWRFRPSKSAKSFQNTWQFNDRPTQWTRHPVLTWWLSVLLMSVMSWRYVYFLSQEAPPFLVAASTTLECLVIQGIQEEPIRQDTGDFLRFVFMEPLDLWFSCHSSKAGLAPNGGSFLCPTWVELLTCEKNRAMIVGARTRVALEFKGCQRILATPSALSDIQRQHETWSTRGSRHLYI